MKKSTLVVFGTLIIMMSSCVYSLFPIYTDDTLLFKEELLGKWKMNEEDYLLFEANWEETQEEDEEEVDYAYSLKIKEGFTISSNEPISITRDGEKIYDEDRIREEMLKTMSEDKPSEQKSEEAKISTNIFEGTVSVAEEKSYLLTIHQNGKDERYVAHLVDIGGDLFMDLYPAEVKYDSDFSMNFFPVHTFMKLSIRDKKLDMTFFDLDKLNKLFERNLIRLRHENVDGTVVITAQPKELQKFLDKYSDDDSVFEETETYSKAS